VNVSIKEKNLVPVVRSIHTIPARLIKAAGRGLAGALLQVVGVSQNEYLAGPRPARLGEVTGRLRRSIQSAVAIYPSKGVIGRIGTNVPYGALHEFGFHGTVQVRAHKRIVKLLTTVGDAIEPRQAILNVAGERVGWRSNRLTAIQRALAKGKAKGLRVRMADVRAHTRTLNYAGRPFIRPALMQSRGVIKSRIDSEIAQVK
jgi:hypothetical protein